MKPIIISALNLFEALNEGILNDFMGLPAKKKIDIIADKINSMMLELIEKEPNSVYVIAWHEYGISSGNSRYVSPEDKTHLKQKMSQVAQMYPNLIIVAGTVAEKKFIPERSKFHARLEAIKTFYEEQEEAEIATLREEMELPNDEDITPYQSAPDSEIGDELNKIDTELDNEEEHSSERCLIRNSTYIFSNNNIYRHNKASPSKETVETKYEDHWTEVDLNYEDDYVSPPKSIFQPFNKRNERYIFKIDVGDNEILTLGIEDCKEHHKGKLKEHVKNIHVDLQLVLSYGGKVDPANIVASNFVLVDYAIPPKLITSIKNSDIDLNSYPVRLYKYSVLNPEKGLDGPYRPLYSEEKDILARLTNLIRSVESESETTISNRDTIYYAISNLKNSFLKSIYAAEPMADKVFQQHESECRQSISISTPSCIVTELNSIIENMQKIQFIINSDEPMALFNPKKPFTISKEEPENYLRFNKKTKFH